MHVLKEEKRLMKNEAQIINTHLFQTEVLPVNKKPVWGVFNLPMINTTVMKQKKIEEVKKVEVNFDADNLSREMRELRPVVFREGDAYCCLLGPDPQKGIFGCGCTADEALADWQHNLSERMLSASQEDELAVYVHDVLRGSNEKVW
jgi:hypothetical protein